jgi:uncharacterized membrane protein YbaN (DUF454 family)
MAKVDPDPPEPPESPATTGLVRWILVSVGLFFAVLGSLGAFLPVLPTTPFVLLAAACFAKSSPTFHRRLLANPLFGSYLAQWQRDHTVPREAKRKAYGMVLVTFSLSIVLLEGAWLRTSLALLGLALIGFLACLPATVTDGDD